MWILIGVIALLAAWSVWGYVSSHVEEATYRVVRQEEGYEVRAYEPHVEARTVVAGPYRTALNDGFRIIAGYIFGNNIAKQKIAMTAPVTAQAHEEPKSEKVAMTAPVLAQGFGDVAHTIAFVMPKSYTLATLPSPKDHRVTLVEVPARKMAALRFRGYATPARTKHMERKLFDRLTRDSVVVTGAPMYAGYNAPWTPPWLTRNEILVPIEG
jgi:hypothetical protein